MSKSHFFPNCVLCLPLLLLYAQANGADPADQTLPPVVVTATRSAQSSFDVPAFDRRGSVSMTERIRSASIRPNILQASPACSHATARIMRRTNRFRFAASARARHSACAACACIPTAFRQQCRTARARCRISVSVRPIASKCCAVRFRRYTAIHRAASSRFSPPMATDPPELRFGLNGGSYGTYRLDANARGRDGMLGYNVDLSQFYTDGYRGHSRAERENGNAKFNVDLGDGRKLTLIANTVALPNADDPLGLTRAQFDTDPRAPQPVAVQFDTRKSVHQEQGGAIYEQSLSDSQGIRVLGYYGQRDVQQFQSIPVATQQKANQPRRRDRPGWWLWRHRRALDLSRRTRRQAFRPCGRGQLRPSGPASPRLQQFLR